MEPGFLLRDRYRIERPLGEGRQGRIFIAEDLSANGIRVAVKCLSLADLGGDWKVLELFERECAVLATLDHPGIPRYVDAFVDREAARFVLVQEFVAGRDLEALVREGGALDEPRLRAIASELLGILSYLHHRNPPVIHRDIKPSNVLVTDGGTAKVVDFGAVQIMSPESRGSTVVGTFGYMAPEQFMGRTVPASDLYALGASLVFAATACHPSELPTDGLRLTFREKAKLSAEFATFLDRLLEPNPSARLTTAEDARVALAKRQGRAMAPWLLGGTGLASILGLGVLLLTRTHATRLTPLVAANPPQPSAAPAVQAEPPHPPPVGSADLWVEKAHAAEKDADWRKAAAYYALARTAEDRADARWGAALTGTRGPFLRWAARADSTDDPHTGVSTVALSQDGKTIATAVSSKEHTWNSMRGVEQLKPEQREITLWDASTGKELGKLQGHTAGVWAVRFSRDGKQLASAGNDWTARLWDVATRTEIRKFEGHAGPVYDVAFSCSFRGRLASGGQDQTVRIWNTDTSEEVSKLTGHNEAVHGVAFPCFGDHTVLSAGGRDQMDRSIRLWDFDTRKVVASLDGHQLAVRAISMGAGDLASASEDGTVRRWNVRARKAEQVMADHDGQVRAVAMTRNNARIVAGGDDRKIRVWTFHGKRPEAVVNAHRGTITGIALSQDGKTLVSVGDDKMLRLWDLGGLDRGLSGGESHILYSPDSKTLIVNGFRADISIIDTTSRQKRGEIKLGGDRSIAGLTLSRDGRKIAATLGQAVIGDPVQIRIFDAEKRTEISALEAGNSGIEMLAFSPDGTHLASGGSNGNQELKVWDLRSKKVVHTFAVGQGVSAGLFSPDGRWLAASSASSGAVKLWDTKTWMNLSDLEIGRAYSVRLATTGDGRLLAAGGSDGVVHVWSTQDWKAVTSYTAHPGRVLAMAFAPDGKTLATTGEDRTVRFWDAATWREAASFSVEDAYNGGAQAVAFSPDGKALAWDGWTLEMARLDVLDPPADYLRRKLAEAHLTLSGSDLVDAKPPL